MYCHDLEAEPWLGRTWGAQYFCPKSYLNLTYLNSIYAPRCFSRSGHKEDINSVKNVLNDFHDNGIEMLGYYITIRMYSKLYCGLSGDKYIHKWKCQ